jgi:hypothetical protein
LLDWFLESNLLLMHFSNIWGLLVHSCSLGNKGTRGGKQGGPLLLF